MKLLSKGYTGAFDELYKRYKNRLIYYFYRMLGNSNEKAQDFLQDIFYKIIEKPEQYNPDNAFKTWLFSVAHNMCKNEYRRLAVRSIVSNEYELDSIEESIELQSRQEQIVDLIYRELNKLNESYRSAFILKYREGFQLYEIASILNTPEGTIKSRLYYARKKIYNALKDKVEDTFEIAV